MEQKYRSQKRRGLQNSFFLDENTKVPKLMKNNFSSKKVTMPKSPKFKNIFSEVETWETEGETFDEMKNFSKKHCNMKH